MKAKVISNFDRHAQTKNYKILAHLKSTFEESYKERILAQKAEDEYSDMEESNLKDKRGSKKQQTKEEVFQAEREVLFSLNELVFRVTGDLVSKSFASDRYTFTNESDAVMEIWNDLNKDKYILKYVKILKRKENQSQNTDLRK